MCGNDAIGCKEPMRDSITEKSKRMGEMLEETRMVISLMGERLFGDSPIEGKRPEPKCLEEDMNLNCIAIENMLGTLKFIADRLL